MTSKDLPVEITKALIKEFGESLPDPLSERLDVDAYAEKVIKHGTVLLAMAEQVSLALAAMYANDQDTKRAYVSLLAVRPELRGRGIARELVNACVENARESGMMCIQLRTPETNTRAMQLYARAGFVKTGRIGMKAVLEINLSTPSL